MMPVDVGIKKDFETIRATIEEHLSAINENTSEIQAMFDYLAQLETRLEKLSGRLDQMELNSKQANLTITPLNQIERKVFFTIYTEELPLSCCEIAARCNVSAPIVSECLSNLSAKGVPLIRSLVNDRVFIKMDTIFKERQAKENLIHLSLENFM